MLGLIQLTNLNQFAPQRLLLGLILLTNFKALTYISPTDITVGFDPTNYEVNEADGTAVLSVVLLNGTLERDVTVLFETAPDSSTQDSPGKIQLYYVA